MKNFPKSKRFRIIVNGISFYTTAGQIADGVGSSTSLNKVCRIALDTLKENGDAGIGTRIENYDLQLDII